MLVCRRLHQIVPSTKLCWITSLSNIYRRCPSTFPRSFVTFSTHQAQLMTVLRAKTLPFQVPCAFKYTYYCRFRSCAFVCCKYVHQWRMYQSSGRQGRHHCHFKCHLLLDTLTITISVYMLSFAASIRIVKHVSVIRPIRATSLPFQVPSAFRYTVILMWYCHLLMQAIIVDMSNHGWRKITRLC